jgi:hypothetical protein
MIHNNVPLSQADAVAPSPVLIPAPTDPSMIAEDPRDAFLRPSTMPAPEGILPAVEMPMPGASAENRQINAAL